MPRIGPLAGGNFGLGFAQSIAELIDNGFDFANTPTNFGNKAADVAAGAPAAVGPVTFVTSFTIA